MQLFQLKNYRVIFEPQTMLIKEFADIRDNNKENDDLTYKERAFVWYFADVRSDFQNELDDDRRMLEIKHRISLPEEWKPNKFVLNAIDFYKEYSKTASSGLYNACLVSAKFIENKLKNPDKLLGEKDSRDNPIYKLKDISDLMKTAPLIMKNLHAAREQVIKEIEAKAEIKGKKERALFEDGI